MSVYLEDLHIRETCREVPILTQSYIVPYYVPYFIILLCLMPDDFTHQGRSAGAQCQWVKFNFFLILIASPRIHKEV